MYRLLADILNDIAFILDCLSPVFPKAIRVVILSFSSVLRALCGVAAGSAKASLSAHFAKWGNLGELNAKDSSQETVISLFGMLVGSLVVSWVTTPFATWTTLILLLSIHLETNRRAVRAVKMRTLNRQRATLVYHHLRKGHVPTPDDISKQERIFERDGVLRGSDDEVLGYCSMGVPMSRLVSLLATQHNPETSSSVLPERVLQGILQIFHDRQYLMWFEGLAKPAHLNVVIKKNATPADLLVAWWHALELAIDVNDGPSLEKLGENEKSGDISYQMLRVVRTAQSAASLFEKYNEQLRKVGWDMDLGALEIPSSGRISIDR